MNKPKFDWLSVNKSESAFDFFDEKRRLTVVPDCTIKSRVDCLFVPKQGEKYVISHEDLYYIIRLVKEGYSTPDTLIHMLDFRYFCDEVSMQSGVVEDEETRDLDCEDEQNVCFKDEAEEIVLTVGKMSNDPTFTQGIQEDALLGNFLSRPIEIYRRLWELNAATPFLDVINPWDLFLNNPKVAEKLSTFKMMHATMHVKFLINGSPFHYGRVFIGIRPTRYDNNTSNVDMQTLVPTTNYYSDYGVPGVRSSYVARTLYSSRPHVFLDPQTNQPAHIAWPFFAGTNWIDLTLDESYDRMGRLEIWELNQLKIATAATADNVTISALAWLEDVTLTGLTHKDPVQMQSSKPKGKKNKSKTTLSNNTTKANDEYHADGAISAPASVVATAAGYFTEIPYIGRFAKATQMAAGTVGDIAKLFGFSKPVNLSDINFMRPMPYGNLANVVGSDPIIKLTVDPKQELTVDPATVGLPGDDQMAIGYIIKKEAWVDTIPWSQAVLANRKLYSAAVLPIFGPATNPGDPDVAVLWQTPLSFASRPFQYWSGSIKYRFQIVASQFHRGRIAIQYDPSPDAGFTSTTVPPPMNERYTRVVDISVERDFTIEIKWSQVEAYRFVNDEPVANRWATIGAVGSGISTDINRTNGRFEMYVLNELTSPLDDADVEINLYISAGDDFELKAPTDNLSLYAYARNDITVGPPATTQSGVAITEDENLPTQASTAIINGSYVGCDPNRSHVYFGESIVSIRALLKRYNFHRVLSAPTATASSLVAYNWDVFTFPIGPGPSYGSSEASALTPITGSSEYGACNLTYLRYFMQAYIGWRGGIRYKMAVIENDNFPNSFTVRRNSTPGVEGDASADVRGAGITKLGAVQGYLAADYGFTKAGAAITTTHVNNVLEYEVPLQTPYRYVETNEPRVGGNRYQSNYIGGMHSIGATSITAASANWYAIETFVASGEDFSLFFFIGAPPITSSDVPTLS